ncbi:YjhX family toxin [Sandarakinorhabdus sp. DWP1-3-1]|uniref:YjhX family toxin n=1 Tax=Sandarakinorhabdus sp. DWP1-3-1 TaxID=2804627 RepID=UPI003CFB9339
MNISRNEQRVLHALAQGGAIRHDRDGDRIIAATCFTREGHALADFNLAVLARLRRRGLVASKGGQPYRISPAGLRAVRAQFDNR